MPTPNRPRPIRLNAAPRTEARPPSKGKNGPRKRPTKSSSKKSDTSLLTWTGVILGVILLSLVCVYLYIQSNSKPKPEPAPIAATHPAPPPPVQPPVQAPTPPTHPLVTSTKPAAPVPPKTPTKAELAKIEAAKAEAAKAEAAKTEVAKTLKEKADEETQHLVEQTATKPVVVPVKPTTTGTLTTASSAKKPAAPETVAASATPTAPTLPPVVQPAPATTAKGAPARALPLDPNVLNTERIAAYQVALERIHFSCGFIDGDQGMRTQRMLRAFQTSRGIPVTGVLDQATRDAVGEPGEPFVNYTVTADDIGSIMPKPPTWKAKAAATRLGYNDIWDLLGEKFHCARGYLKALNPGVTTPVAGTELIGPKVYPAAPIPHANSLRIYLGETEIEALDANGKIIAFFPCSIAKDKAKRPSGILTVKVVDPHPDYTFDPALFVDAAKAENITHKMVLPPGPRNPVGTDWVGLSLAGYGIHGTPEPEKISATQSHGCFRLANWNADKVLKMVKVGTTVDVQP